MNPLAWPAELRALIKPLLPRGAFLRRARGGGTFVTDAMGHTDTAMDTLLARSGFTVRPEGTLLFLSPGPDLLRRFEEEADMPADLFPQSLTRLAGLPPCVEALTLFAVGSRLLEAAAPGDTARYMKSAHALAALCLRKHSGGALACAVIAATLDTERSDHP